jgi:acyl-coenzyme A synthetase/AMP-(fatty) acid ligase
MTSALGHDPLLREVFGALYAGAPLDIPSDEIILSDLPSWLRQRATTILHATPQLIRLIAKSKVPLPDLRHVFSGGDVLTWADVDALKGVAPEAGITNFYGTTETPQAVAFCDLDQWPGQRRPTPPIGAGVPPARIVVRAPFGHAAGTFERGEIAVYSPLLAEGYVETEGRTAKFPGSPGQYRTGDIGWLDVDGSLQFVARGTGQASINGSRISLSDVEACIEQHPAIARAGVCARRLPDTSDRLVAFAVKSQDGATAEATDILAWLRSRVPRVMVPHSLIFVDRLPLTATRKIDRRALADLDQDPVLTDHAVATVPDRVDSRGSLVLAIWRDALSDPSAADDRDWFTAGGSSLQMMTLISKMHELAGVELTVKAIFEGVTARELAAQAARRR